MLINLLRNDTKCLLSFCFFRMVIVIVIDFLFLLDKTTTSEDRRSPETTVLSTNLTNFLARGTPLKWWTLTLRVNTSY